MLFTRFREHADHSIIVNGGRFFVMLEGHWKIRLGWLKHTHSWSRLIIRHQPEPLLKKERLCNQCFLPPHSYPPVSDGTMTLHRILLVLAMAIYLSYNVAFTAPPCPPHESDDVRMLLWICLVTMHSTCTNNFSWRNIWQGGVCGCGQGQATQWGKCELPQRIHTMMGGGFRQSRRDWVPSLPGGAFLFFFYVNLN